MFQKSIVLLLLLLPFCLDGQSFERDQLRNHRVQQAKADKDGTLRANFARRSLNYAPQNMYLRAFKHERILEVWVQSNFGEDYVKYRDYIFCEFSGRLGPKKRQGDEQIPEGFYFINEFNPNSNYYLSLGLNYPNPADRKKGSGNLGGDIFIHGDCVTIGCIPLTDDIIKELYWLSVKTKSNGQKLIPIHIFPYKFDRTKPYIGETDEKDKRLHAFWDNLKEGYNYFNYKRKPPFVHINADGTYDFF